jgi:murein DD-endopeptidase MepM/ murein hydrolase activator NlpD
MKSLGKLRWSSLSIALLFMCLQTVNAGDIDHKIPRGYPVIKDASTQITREYEDGKVSASTKKRSHAGIDIVTKGDHKVLCTADGVVIDAKFGEKGEGNYVLIQHSDGYVTFYSHLREFTVKPGDVIKKGQSIGYIGNTGRAVNPHLHYEIRKNGHAVSPREYLD